MLSVAGPLSNHRGGIDREVDVTLTKQTVNNVSTVFILISKIGNANL